MGFFDKVSAGLARSRDRFKEQMNVLLDRGPNLDEDFWETLEETLILADVGGMAASDIVERLRDTATRRALPDAYAVLDLLREHIAATFTEGGAEILGGDPAVVLFVGINGTGKTTTVGKLAKEATDAGRRVILGSADTFRAAAIEQLEVWARRANVEMVTRERGADPASVCYDTLERAEAVGADLVLIDTAGRLHTSTDLMRELEKVVGVVRKRSKLPVYTVLVIDATTGQNGLQQAREFNRALHLDALIVTKLDGTAKGGIALAVSHELELPIVKIGVGESIDDLRDFDADDFAAALIGDFDERYEDEEAGGASTKMASLAADEAVRAASDDGFDDGAEGAWSAAAAAARGDEGEGEGRGQDVRSPMQSAPAAAPSQQVDQPEASSAAASVVEDGSGNGDADAADDASEETGAAEGVSESDGEDAAGARDGREGSDPSDAEFADMARMQAADRAAASFTDAAEDEQPPEKKRKKHFWERWR